MTKTTAGLDPEGILEDGISAVLARAARANDADTACLFADVLNTDLAAIERLGGRRRFDSDDAMRIARILGEYQQLARLEFARPGARPKEPPPGRQAARDL